VRLDLKPKQHGAGRGGLGYFGNYVGIDRGRLAGCSNCPCTGHKLVLEGKLMQDECLDNNANECTSRLINFFFLFFPSLALLL
jgi:hypothetical protein